MDGLNETETEFTVELTVLQFSHVKKFFLSLKNNIRVFIHKKKNRQEVTLNSFSGISDTFI